MCNVARVNRRLHTLSILYTLFTQYKKEYTTPRNYVRFLGHWLLKNDDCIQGRAYKSRVPCVVCNVKLPHFPKYTVLMPGVRRVLTVDIVGHPIGCCTLF